MPDLDAPRMDAVGAGATPRTERHRFVFSGVAFEVLADARARFALPEAYREHVDHARACVLAEVICSVSGDAGRRTPTPTDESRALTFHHAGAHTQIAARDMLVEVSEIARSKYAAAARIAPNSRGAGALALGVSSAIVQRRGGLNLHAAAIELDGQAVLFLGPSGAGKSTAAGLSGADVFANDRVCVAPDDTGRFWAFSLPGGEPVVGARRSERRALPLAGCLRVRQSPLNTTPSLRAASEASGLFAVRAAASSADCDPESEDSLLQSVQQLCGRVPVLDLHTVLTKPIATLLRAGLAGGCDAHI